MPSASLSELPPELVLHILQYLPLPSLQAVSQISSEWHNFCQRNQSTIYHQAALLHQFISSLDVTLSEAKSSFPARSIEETPDWRSFCMGAHRHSSNSFSLLLVRYSALQAEPCLGRQRTSFVQNVDAVRRSCPSNQSG